MSIGRRLLDLHSRPDSSTPPAGAWDRQSGQRSSSARLCDRPLLAPSPSLPSFWCASSAGCGNRAGPSRSLPWGQACSLCFSPVGDRLRMSPVRTRGEASYAGGAAKNDVAGVPRNDRTYLLGIDGEIAPNVFTFVRTNDVTAGSFVCCGTTRGGRVQSSRALRRPGLETPSRIPGSAAARRACSLVAGASQKIPDGLRHHALSRCAGSGRR